MNPANKIQLALNLVLLGALLVAITQRSFSGAKSSLKKEAVPAEMVPSAIPTPRQQSYLELGSPDDWRQWLDQLRAGGVPTPVLARIVQLGFEDRWQTRQLHAQAAFAKCELDSSGLAVLSIQHDREVENEMRAALGDAEFKRYDLQIVLRSLPWRGVSLTPAESEAIYALEKELEYTGQDLGEMKLKGEIDQAEYERRLEKAQAEHDRQFKDLLGDERYARMYPSPNETAEKLRQDIRAIALPGEVSFDTLVDIQNQWNERCSEAQARLQEAKTRISNCEDELRKLSDAVEIEHERLLGTNGYAAAVKDSDARYQEMKRHAQEWLLDTAAIDHIFRTLQYYDKATEEYLRQVQTLEANGDLAIRETANQNLRRFARQTEECLQSYLGQERFNLLKQRNVLQFSQSLPSK